MKSIAYEAVYNQIIAEMDKGNIPWKKPWNCPPPQNAKTSRLYSGVNFFLLSFSNFADNRWVTYKQATDLGGKVKAGEKSKQIVFWNIMSFEEDSGKKKSIPLLKYFNVFNVEQVDGLNIEPLAKREKVLKAEEVIEGYKNKPKVQHIGNRACYSPSTDVVSMPHMEHFNSENEYYSVYFHELIHSTGLEKRLNRKGVVNFDTFGTEQYSEEELVAEFGAAFLCSACGIDNTLQNSAAYIKGWREKFKSDPSIIVHAASKAQAAANYILNIESE